MFDRKLLEPLLYLAAETNRVTEKIGSALSQVDNLGELAQIYLFLERYKQLPAIQKLRDTINTYAVTVKDPEVTEAEETMVVQGTNWEYSGTVILLNGKKVWFVRYDGEPKVPPCPTLAVQGYPRVTLDSWGQHTFHGPLYNEDLPHPPTKQLGSFYQTKEDALKAVKTYAVQQFEREDRVRLDKEWETAKYMAGLLFSSEDKEYVGVATLGPNPGEGEVWVKSEYLESLLGSNEKSCSCYGWAAVEYCKLCDGDGCDYCEGD